MKISEITIEQAERLQIRLTLKRFEWNVREAAKSFGIHRRTLQRKIKRYGLERPVKS